MTTLLFELPTGGLADAVGRKPVLLVATVAQAGMLLALAFGTTIWHFVAGAVLGGIGRVVAHWSAGVVVRRHDTGSGPGGSAAAGTVVGRSRRRWLVLATGALCRLCFPRSVRAYRSTGCSPS